MKCLALYNVYRFLLINSFLTLLLVGASVRSFAQYPSIQADKEPEELIPITRWGIHLDFIQKGNGKFIQEGEYVFCRFVISRGDSILNQSGPNVLDNVVFIPVNFKTHSNAAIYDVFTNLDEGSEVRFEIPFRLLPWKDQLLGDDDSIQYNIKIDSVKTEEQYRSIYESYIDQIEADLEKNKQETAELKRQILEELKIFDENKLKSAFKKHKQGYWYWNIHTKKSNDNLNSKHTVRFKYMTILKYGDEWDQQYFNPLYMEIQAEDKTLPEILELTLHSMHSFEQKVLVFDKKGIENFKLLSIENIPDYLCFWFEVLE